ncbi:hypothetical protein ACKWTF_013615 [Chironomus riparius]
MKLFIVLACIVAVTIADHDKNGKQSKNPVCSKELTVKPTDCCPGMPSLKEHFDKCALQCNQSASADPSVTTAAPEKRGRGRHGSGNKQFYKCLMPCVIESAGILGPDGNVSSDLLSQQLLNGASSEWAPIVSNAVSSCFANATAKAQRKAKAGKNKQSEKQSSNDKKACDKLNGMIMKCVFKSLYTACPTPVDSTECKELNEKMAQCPCEHEGRGEGRAAKKGGKKEKKEKKNKGKQTDAPVESEM